MCVASFCLELLATAGCSEHEAQHSPDEASVHNLEQVYALLTSGYSKVQVLAWSFGAPGTCNLVRSPATTT